MDKKQPKNKIKILEKVAPFLINVEKETQYESKQAQIIN
jgi:hypothetical protein